MRTRLVQTGAEAVYSTGQELAERIKSETVKWGKVARVAGVQAE